MDPGFYGVNKKYIFQRSLLERSKFTLMARESGLYRQQARHASSYKLSPLTRATLLPTATLSSVYVEHTLHRTRISQGTEKIQAGTVVPRVTIERPRLSICEARVGNLFTETNAYSRR